MEFLWPLILFVVLAWVRTRGLKEHRPNCKYFIWRLFFWIGYYNEIMESYECLLRSSYRENLAISRRFRILPKFLLHIKQYLLQRLRRKWRESCLGKLFVIFQSCEHILYYYNSYNSNIINYGILCVYRLISFIRDSSPLLKDIASSNKGIGTVSKIWEDLMSYTQVISAFRTKDETSKIGAIL